MKIQLHLILDSDYNQKSSKIIEVTNDLELLNAAIDWFGSDDVLNARNGKYSLVYDNIDKNRYNIPFQFIKTKDISANWGIEYGVVQTFYVFNNNVKQEVCINDYSNPEGWHITSMPYDDITENTIEQALSM